MAKKKKKRKRVFRNSCDWHHLLWTRRSYDKGYARALRQHPYTGCYIPRDTLHRLIHHEIKTVPVPDGSDARRVYELLVRMENAGELDFNDGILERLDFLINHLESPATVRVLIKQKQIVNNFYHGGEE